MNKMSKKKKLIEVALPLVAINTASAHEKSIRHGYGVEEPNPSVISLNAVSAAHGVNSFLLDYLGLRPDGGQLYYEHFHFLKNTRMLVEPRRSEDCPECSHAGQRYGRGDSVALPCIEG